MNALDELALEYGTDKCPQIYHSYTPYYYELLKDRRQDIKKVLEIGVGFAEPRPDSLNRQQGASLYMWRDFFPNAQIYGADNLPECVFKDDRIETFLCDQSNRDDLKKLIENTGSDIDLLIDDGSHMQRDQAKTCLTLMPMLKKDVIYIIEDVRIARNIERWIGEHYDFETVGFHRNGHHDDRVMVVKNR